MDGRMIFFFAQETNYFAIKIKNTFSVSLHCRGHHRDE
jgi:hypothetical protein